MKYDPETTLDLIAMNRVVAMYEYMYLFKVFGTRRPDITKTGIAFVYIFLFTINNLFNVGID